MKKYVARWRREDGAVAIIMAFAMVALLGFTALAVDYGLYYANKAQLQTAVDAAALAACRKLPNTSQATLTAKEYVEKNGFTQENISVTFLDDNSSIKVTGNKQQTAFFAGIFGIKQLDYNCSATASSVRTSLGPAFNHLIYSGNTHPEQPGYGSFSVRLQNVCTFSGLTNWVFGSVHSNFNLDANTSNIVGIGEAVGTVVGNNILYKIPGQGLIPMPDFSMYKAQMKAEAIAAGQYYSGNFSSANSSFVNVTAPLYVEGDANLNGISFSGKGTIYAGGQITMTGSGGNYDSRSKICMYSDYTSKRKSDAAIDFAGSGKNFTGILYAPNGSILVTGSNYTFKGNVIGRVVDIGGSNKRFYGAENIAESFPYSTNVSVALVQ